MNAARLRAQCLPEGARSTYVMVTIDDVLAGNAFASRWSYAGRQVCWITQLVVHSEYRERRLATALLSSLIDSDDDAFGIMSSHPAACKALALAIGGTCCNHPFLESEICTCQNGEYTGTSQTNPR